MLGRHTDDEQACHFNVLFGVCDWYFADEEGWESGVLKLWIDLWGVCSLCVVSSYRIV